jgi:hypothetical protein
MVKIDINHQDKNNNVKGPKMNINSDDLDIIKYEIENNLIVRYKCQIQMIVIIPSILIGLSIIIISVMIDKRDNNDDSTGSKDKVNIDGLYQFILLSMPMMLITSVISYLVGFYTCFEKCRIEREHWRQEIQNA